MGKLEMGKIINHNMGKLFINMGTQLSIILIYLDKYAGWWFGTCLIFPNIGNNNSN